MKEEEIPHRRVQRYACRPWFGSILFSRWNFGEVIEDILIRTGKGGVKPLRPETVEGLCEQIGGKPSEWQHCKGIGLLDREGEECEAEVHWFQEPSVGKHRFRVKEWLE